MATETNQSILLEERFPGPKRRQYLLKELGKQIGRTVVAFFTSFIYPVMIEDDDADMIEDTLQATNLRDGLCLMLNSPGGDALAAERIIHTCRVYSKNRFSVWIPRRAKSAATMIALGADKIYMGETSALGPIDSQYIKRGVDGESLFPTHIMTGSYDELMDKAISTKGNLEPYLQQLSRYDAAEIAELRRANDLAEDIAIRSLKQGMLKKMSIKDIKKNISIFLEPDITKAHGRDIRIDDVKKAGLNLQVISIEDPMWKLISEYYTRADFLVSSDCSKLVESADHHFHMERPESDSEDDQT